MWFRSLFDSLLARSTGTPAPRRGHGPQARPRPLRFRPLLDILEDRTLPSTYTVNSLTDTGAGSGLTGDLRYCITKATSGQDTIDFAAGLTGAIKLESALPALNASVAIQGPGASQQTVERDPTSTTPFGIFAVGSTANVQISGLTLADADRSAVTNAGTLTLEGSTLSGNTGGAISNTGTLTVSDSTLSGNIGDGAIFTRGTLSISNSTLSGNAVIGSIGNTVEGGAIFMYVGKLSINSCTIANNVAQGGGSSDGPSGINVVAGNGLGGGLYLGGGTVSIDHSTLAGNAAVAGGTNVYQFGIGGGICNSGSELQMHDTIVADNSAEGLAPDLSGSVTSLGYNLVGDGTGSSGFTAPGDQVGTAANPIVPLLGPLQNNGGPTQTMALPTDSPAVNAGDPGDNTNPNTSAYDQRGPGFPRIFGGRIDIGAFEVQNLNGLIVTGFPTTIMAGAATGNSFTVTARNADGSPNTGYTGAITLSSTDPTATFADAATGRPLSGNSYTFQPGGNGTHTFTAVLTKAGSQAIMATDTTTASFTGTEGSILVQPLAASTMIVNDFPSLIDANTSDLFDVTLEDCYGNIASSYTGTVQLSTSDPQATIADPATGNNEALQGFSYSFTATDAGIHGFFATLETVGTQSITATDTKASLTGTEGGITVDTGPASQFLVTSPSTVSAGVPFSFSVTAADSSGQKVTGYTGTVSFTSSDYQPILPVAYTFNAADGGTHTFTATLKAAGTPLITATDTSGLTGTDESTTVLPAAASKLVVSGFPSPITAGTPGTFTVTAEDPYGNVATGYTGTVQFSSSDAKAVLPAAATLTNSTGRFSATLKTAGTQSIMATGTSGLTGTDVGITVNPAAANTFVITAPSSVSAGVTFSLTLTVEDAYGNVVTGYTGTVHFSSTDTRAKLPSNYTFTATDKGVHTFTGLVLRTKGKQKITITDTHNSSLTGSVSIDVL